MQPTVTVTVCDPVILGFMFAVAVIADVPVVTEVTSPDLLTVATLGCPLVHATEGLPVLPSLKVPTAVICTVLFVVPVWIVGDAGPTAIELKVGLTKNPRQLTPKARATNTVKANVSASLRPVNISDRLR